MSGIGILEKAARVALAGLRCGLARSDVPERLRHAGALHLLVKSAGVPGAAAGRALAVSKQYVSKAVRQVEEARTADPEIDAAFEALELAMYPEDV